MKMQAYSGSYLVPIPVPDICYQQIYNQIQKDYSYAQDPSFLLYLQWEPFCP